MQAVSLASTDTEYSADCVEFCPFEGYQDVFICGTYQVLEPKSEHSGEEEITETPRSTQRTGRLLLFQVTDDQRSFIELQRIDTAAILDAKWNRGLRDGQPELAVADAKGHITMFTLNVEKRLLQTTRIEVAGESTLCLSLDWSPFQDSIVTSLSSGSLAHVVHSPNGIDIDQFAAHDYEPWITAFDLWDEGGHTVWSGGDDCKLKRWDMRDTTRPTFVNKQFDAGVTTITPSPHTPHLLAVGSYDSNLRLFDARSAKSPLLTIPVGGGVWRTRFHPDPSRKGDILLATMHDGFKVVHLGEAIIGANWAAESTLAEGNAAILTRFDAHDSLAYGADWCRLPSNAVAGGETGSLIGSCSFYDHAMHLWRA